MPADPTVTPPQADREPDAATRRLLASRAAAGELVRLLERSAQGQFFELVARPDPGAPFRTVARLAGSGLGALAAAEWRPVLARLAGADPVGPPAPVEYGAYRGRPLVWRRPTDPAHLSGFADLRDRLARLRPVGDRYARATEDLGRALAAARTVDAWRAVSRRRLALAGGVAAEVLDWAGAGLGPPPGLLLVGSAAGGFGLASDVDYVPVWASPPGAAGREVLDRFATGLQACGVRADNVVDRWSFRRLSGLTAGGWRAEAAGVVYPFALAGCLAVAGRGPVLGAAGPARDLVAGLSGAGWVGRPGRWRRRWAGWWADLEAKDRAAGDGLAARVPIALRKLTVLREMTDVLPRFGVPVAPAADPSRLRDEVAWVRDVLAAAAPRPGVPPDPGAVARALGLENAGGLATRWRELLAGVAAVADHLFRAAGGRAWRTRVGRPLARWLFRERPAHRGGSPRLLLLPCRLGVV